MRENNYQKLTENIHAPAGLNDRVLRAARRETAERQTRPKHLATRRPPPGFRPAVCAACGLALRRIWGGRGAVAGAARGSP